MRCRELSCVCHVVIASRPFPTSAWPQAVQRRILYAMREMGMEPNKQHRKCAGIIVKSSSRTIRTATRRSTTRSSAWRKISPCATVGRRPRQLRFDRSRSAGRLSLYRGSPGASVARRSGDIEKETVPFIDNFDNQGTEPSVLPAVCRNCAQRFFRYRRRYGDQYSAAQPQRIADAIALLIDDPNADADALCEIVKAPISDRGTILGQEAIKEAYRTGRVRWRFAAKPRSSKTKANSRSSSPRFRIRCTRPHRRSDRRSPRREADSRHRALGRRVQSQGHARGRRAAEERDAQSRPQPTLQAHAAPGVVRL